MAGAMRSVDRNNNNQDVHVFLVFSVCGICRGLCKPSFAFEHSLISPTDSEQDAPIPVRSARMRYGKHVRMLQPAITFCVDKNVEHLLQHAYVEVSDQTNLKGPLSRILNIFKETLGLNRA